MNHKRIESLDYLRGIMAISVMVYHYYIFSIADHELEGLLGKLGIYAVSTFYILSGLSLTLAYYDGVNNFKEVLAYMIKRIFRIFPMIWLATSIALFFTWLGDNTLPDLVTILLNYTLLFGFLKIDSYIATGAWSIGNEMVFYFLFPIIIFFVRMNKSIMLLILFLFIAIALYYAFFVLDENNELSVQWIKYINPFNQVYLFTIGMAIAIFFKSNFMKNQFFSWLWIIILLGFICLPSYDQQVNLITDWERIYYSILFTLMTLLFFIGVGDYNNLFGKILQLLGEISYSIYLLHPLVAIPVVYITSKYGIEKFDAHFYFAIPLTLVSAYISFLLVEKPMIRLGKSLIKRFIIRKELIK